MNWKVLVILHELNYFLKLQRRESSHVLTREPRGRAALPIKGLFFPMNRSGATRNGFPSRFVSLCEPRMANLCNIPKRVQDLSLIHI